MNKIQLAVLALTFAVLGGCANMGGMVGTSAVQADRESNLYYPIEPKTMVDSE